MIASVATGTDPVDSEALAPYAAHGGMQVLVYGGATGQTQQFTRYSNMLQAQRIQVTGANALRLDYDWGPSGKNNGNLRAQTINGGVHRRRMESRRGGSIWWRIIWGPRG